MRAPAVLLKPAELPPPRESLRSLAARPGAFLLESALADRDFRPPIDLDHALRMGPWARWSIAGCEPFRTLRAKGREVEIAEGDRAPERRRADAFRVLRELLARYAAPPVPSPVPFAGGAVGAFGYELGRLVERLPGRVEDDLRLPDLAIGFYDACALWDHATGRAYLAAVELENRPPAAERLERLAERLAAKPPEAPLLALGPGGEPASRFERGEYERTVARVVEYIAAGDIFQANLSQRFEAAWRAGASSLYRALAEVNPAPFASYLDIGGAQLVGSSPELFLRLAPDGRVVTRPIKGTRPRGATPDEDAALARALLASAKDNAELAMIVDLERNDLGRVCDYGSVRVAEPCVLESYPNVHHLVSTVEGRLARGRDLTDLLRASFPGGSITGAPKIRAMEIIDELEKTARSYYTGSVGFIGFDGAMELNIVIRSFILKDARAYFQVGGGVVADSTPEGEYDETLDKARGLFAALRSRASLAAGDVEAAGA